MFNQVRPLEAQADVPDAAKGLEDVELLGEEEDGLLEVLLGDQAGLQLVLNFPPISGTIKNFPTVSGMIWKKPYLQVTSAVVSEAFSRSRFENNKFALRPQKT